MCVILSYVHIIFPHAVDIHADSTCEFIRKLKYCVCYYSFCTLSRSHAPANAALIVSVTTILILVITLCLAIILVIVCKSKVKRFFQKWILSSSQRWVLAIIEGITSSNTAILYKRYYVCILCSLSHGEDPIDLTDVKYAKQMIGKTPAFIHYSKCMYIHQKQ